jgi:hypothetical protein
MKKKQQINNFLKQHDLEPDALLAHDAFLEIKTAYEWAKIFLFSKEGWV